MGSLSQVQTQNQEGKDDDVEELFLTGRDSDITIVCGRAKWKLHKRILAARCPWFAEVLEDEDTEKDLNEMVFFGDKQVMDCVVRWIYLRKIDPMYYSITKSYYPHVYEATDIFGLDDLMDLVEDELGAALREKAIQWQRGYHQMFHEDKPQFRFEYQVDLIREGIIESYKVHLPRMRRLWVNFVEATMFWPVAYGTLEPIFDAVPKYSDDVLESLVSRQQTPALFRSVSACRFCRVCPFNASSGPYRFYVEIYQSPYGIEGKCNRCFPNRLALFKTVAPPNMV